MEYFLFFVIFIFYFSAFFDVFTFLAQVQFENLKCPNSYILLVLSDIFVVLLFWYFMHFWVFLKKLLINIWEGNQFQEKIIIDHFPCFYVLTSEFSKYGIISPNFNILALGGSTHILTNVISHYYKIKVYVFGYNLIIFLFEITL